MSYSIAQPIVPTLPWQLATVRGLGAVFGTPEDLTLDDLNQLLIIDTWDDESLGIVKQPIVTTLARARDMGLVDLPSARAWGDERCAAGDLLFRAHHEELPHTWKLLATSNKVAISNARNAQEQGVKIDNVHCRTKPKPEPKPKPAPGPAPGPAPKPGPEEPPWGTYAAVGVGVVLVGALIWYARS